MGRGNGVIVREKSIQLFFVLDGKPMKKTLRAGGKPLLPTPANIRFAERTAIDIRTRLAAGNFMLADFFPDDPMATVGIGTTVGAQLDKWFDAQRVEASTRKAYGSAIKFWKQAPVEAGGAAMDITPIKALRHSHVLHAVASRPGLSGKTVNNYVSVLRESLEMAVIDGALASNPVAKVPRAKHQKKPPDPFTAAEVELILADMRVSCPLQVHNYTAFKFFTGVRTSEVDALQWSRVDLARGEVEIAEAMVRGVHKDRTKTNVARSVRLNSRSRAALESQLELTGKARGAVFHDPRYGAAWADERAFRRSFWIPCLKRLDMRYRPPYNTRHTYATDMLMAGMKPAFCAGQMGHSVEIFHSTYAKWIDSARDAQEMDLYEARLQAAGRNFPATSLDPAD